MVWETKTNKQNLGLPVLASGASLATALFFTLTLASYLVFSELDLSLVWWTLSTFPCWSFSEPVWFILVLQDLLWSPLLWRTLLPMAVCNHAVCQSVSLVTLSGLMSLGNGSSVVYCSKGGSECGSLHMGSSSWKPGGSGGLVFLCGYDEQESHPTGVGARSDVSSGQVRVLIGAPGLVRVEP
jgi:hypothetical protein